MFSVFWQSFVFNYLRTFCAPNLPKPSLDFASFPYGKCRLFDRIFEMSRFAALFFHEVDVRNGHGAVDGLAHVVYRQQAR